MKVSIVIPIFNKWNFTKSCLNDLSALDKNTHELIVVSDGSTDETDAEISKLNISNLLYFRKPTNTGFANTCNLGYGKSSGDYIIFLNNDIRIQDNHNNWTDLLIDKAEKGNCLAGPTGGYVDPKNEFNFKYETNDKNKEINYMSGWCLAGNRNTWDRLHINDYQGPFSEEYGKAYFEDTDLSFRATQMGIVFELVDIPVIHFGKISSKQLNTAKLYNEAKKIFNKKWSNKK
jgi:GT2 family glycosyltransferase